MYEGHTGMVLSIIQVGNQLYSGSSDCTIREWDTKKAECIKVFTGHTGNVECLAFGDGRLYPTRCCNVVFVVFYQRDIRGRGTIV